MILHNVFWEEKHQKEEEKDLKNTERKDPSTAMPGQYQ